MTKRSKRQQNKHDKAVEKSAEYYKKQGYKVEADIKGFKKPKNISGRIPDVRAVKKGDEAIIEVETKKSLDKDKKQREKFKKYADRSKNRRFRKRIIK
ncbi:MAG: hypothetical protein WD607_01985 [Candidatus Paceibacterota bacterium]